MVRTLDADRNAELERRYSVSYGNDRGNRKNMQTGRSSGAAKNTRGTQTARRRKDTDAAGTAGRTAGTGRTTGGRTAGSTARTSSTGRTTGGSTVRTTGTARTAATVRTTGTSAVTRHAGTAGNAETARTARPAGTARTAGTVRSGRNINRNEQKRRIARETARGRGVRVDEASRTTTVPERRVRSSAMSFQSVIVMLALIVAMTVILVFYITLQAEVTGSSQQIANLEEQLTELKAENDASYNEITDSISLEEVRKKAIYELGMKYADRNQVVIYSGTEKDSVHQVSSLNDH